MTDDKTTDDILKRLMVKAPKSPYSWHTDVEVWAQACQAFAEALAEKAAVVYCASPSPRETTIWNGEKGDIDTHTAILVDVQPIDKAVPVSEILSVLKHCNLANDTRQMLASRIEKWGVKP
jgi:hypothetical protein